MGLARLLPRLGLRRTVVGLTLVSLVVGLFLPWTNGRRRLFEPPAAGSAVDPAGRPNVLLLVWDTTRAESLSTYSNDRPTSPRLDAFAERSLVFDEARSVTIFTFTSHLSLLTGVYPSRHGGRLVNMHYDARRATTVAALFQRAGYRTGAFVSTSVLSRRYGINAGFEEFDDQVDPLVSDTRGWNLVHDLQSIAARKPLRLRHNGRPNWFQDFERPGDQTLARAKAWIEEPDERPWFAMVNLYDAHWPYLPSASVAAELVAPYDGPMNGYASRANALYGSGYRPNEAYRRHLTELYEAEIHDLDARVAAFLAELEPRTGPTGVVITADHGEAFGEAGVWEHDDIFEPQVRVPLVVHLPGPDAPSGRIPGHVSGIDVAPTLLGLAGLEAPAGYQGLDLTRERPAEDRVVLVEDRDHGDPTDIRLALYDGTWKAVERHLGGRVEFHLHDLAADPVGDVDLAQAEPERLRAMIAELRGMREELGLGHEVELGAAGTENLDALRGLGYLGE